MEIDRNKLKALSVDSRLDIMKCLTKRRMLPSELSKRLGLAPSTVTEHLKKLEDAGIVSKVDTGHKWIYYELTEEGMGLVKPDSSVRFVLVLTLGVIFVFSSIVQWFQQAVSMQNIRTGTDDMLAEGTAGGTKDIVTAPGLETVAQIDFLFWVLLIIGIVLILLSLVMKFRK
ncbi:MAG: winged helix-turn-helix domain-containing protein [Candidatus Aenigmatarchaeota archaeon]|nr:winged helix-turn-helix domain-containing protein [Nanoarchaeota archaeon]